MNEIEFYRLEYETLRREIESIKANIFRTIGLGLGGIPGMYFVSQQFELQELSLAIPLMVVVVGLLYLSENHALMRCGKYIREKIEPTVGENIGWESWLSDDSHDRRTVDKFLSYAFYLMFVVYYFASVYVSMRYAYATYPAIVSYAISAFHIGIGLAFTVFVILNIRVTTTTKADI